MTHVRGRNRVGSPGRWGFTLVELLVVIGIISVLISILLPAVNRMRGQALSAKCKAQMRDIGIALQIYSQEYRGWLYPVGEFDPIKKEFKTLGTEPEWAAMYPNYKDPNDKDNDWLYHGRFLRWPNYVDLGVNPRVWNPPILKCPTDPEAGEQHTYILNKHLADTVGKVIKAGGHIEGRSPSEVLLMGEKKSDSDDYYMGRKSGGSTSEFDIVEPYRHGIKLGSNYLYLDGHVDLLPPAAMEDLMDSWDVKTDTGTTPPATPGVPPTP